ncbi:MAG: hypothetical protein AB7O24_30655 [Kofleriaceae bacterium]
MTKTRALAALLCFLIPAVGPTIGAADPKKPAVKTRRISLTDELAKVGLTFAIPPGFELAPVKDNRAVEYAFAIKSKRKKLEARYAFRPIAPESSPGADNDAVYELLIKASVANIGKGASVELDRLPADFAISQLGTADARLGMFRPRAPGWTGYSTCMILTMRTAQAEGYVFVLFDDLKALHEEIAAASSALRFAVPTPGSGSGSGWTSGSGSGSGGY